MVTRKVVMESKGHFIKWKGVWSAETFKVKTINWCAQYFIKLLKWKVKSFLTDAANQIPDNDWTLVAKCDNRCQPMRGLSEANWPITILEKRASICFQNSSKQKLWSNVWLSLDNFKQTLKWELHLFEIMFCHFSQTLFIVFCSQVEYTPPWCRGSM